MLQEPWKEILASVLRKNLGLRRLFAMVELLKGVMFSFSYIFGIAPIELARAFIKNNSN